MARILFTTPTDHSMQILFAYEDEVGDDVIASLDFWGRPQSPSAPIK